jgi:DNA-directed RNA polymerase subunit RPC12/RpoP
MRQKFYQFMQGRYGVDQLSRVLTWISLICIVLSNFVGGYVLNSIGVVGFVFAYYRIFSKNHPKRYRENQKFLMFTSNFRNLFRKGKDNMHQRKTYHIYKCPTCKQKIRIPKGKGKIEIRCPKCQKTFVKRS